MPILTRTAVTYPLPQRSLISWSALLGGLALTTALGWLLMLLGSAFGMTIADTTDVDALDAGFGIGATIWFIVSWIAAYFIGAVFAARTSGARDKHTGMFHGVGVWSLGAIVTAFMTASGVQSAVSAGTAVASAGASTLSSIDTGSVDTESFMVGQTGKMLEDVATELQAELRGQAARLAAEVDGTDGATREEIEQSIDELDARSMRRIGTAIFTGEPERAKSVLAAETSLSEKDIESLVTGVERETKERIDEVRTAATAAAESAANYGQAVLWIAFVSAALALLAAIFGGGLGANTDDPDSVTRVTERVATP